MTIPNPLMIRKIHAWIRAKILHLSDLRDRPHAVALGIASGIFFGFVPLFGFKTLLAMGVAKLSRGNVISAAIAVTLHDVILPLAPVLLRWEYQLGSWLLHHPHHAVHPSAAAHQGVSMWFHWSTLFSVGLPLILGSVIIGTPFAIVSYFLSLRLLERSAARKAGALLQTGGES